MVNNKFSINLSDIKTSVKMLGIRIMFEKLLSSWCCWRRVICLEDNDDQVHAYVDVIHYQEDMTQAVDS